MSVPSFTLDTNCVIAVDERRPEAPHILRLVQAHKDGRADVGVVAISASERQKDGKLLENFGEFKSRLAALGLSQLRMLHPMMYWDVTFWDASVYADDESEALEQRIHGILFPNMPFKWVDFCKANGLDPDHAPLSAKWRNAKCDVQAMWTHITSRRSVFVTSDRNFGAGEMLQPAAAAQKL